MSLVIGVLHQGAGLLLPATCRRPVVTFSVGVRQLACWPCPCGWVVSVASYVLMVLVRTVRCLSVASSDSVSFKFSIGAPPASGIQMEYFVDPALLQDINFNSITGLVSGQGVSLHCSSVPMKSDTSTCVTPLLHLREHTLPTPSRSFRLAKVGSRTTASLSPGRSREPAVAQTRHQQVETTP